MTLIHRLQALKPRRKSGHGHKLGQAKGAPALCLVDAPVVQVETSPRAPRRAASSAADVLPSIDYTLDVGELDSAPSLVSSSSSYASGMTLADFAVDDGLTPWGLPKVVGQDEDEEEEELFFDCEETLPMSLSAQPQPSASQLKAQMTLTLVYTAILTRRARQSKDVRPVRPQSAPIAPAIVSQPWFSRWL